MWGIKQPFRCLEVKLKEQGTQSILSEIIAQMQNVSQSSQFAQILICALS